MACRKLHDLTHLIHSHNEVAVKHVSEAPVRIHTLPYQHPSVSSLVLRIQTEWDNVRGHCPPCKPLPHRTNLTCHVAKQGVEAPDLDSLFGTLPNLRKVDFLIAKTVSSFSVVPIVLLLTDLHHLTELRWQHHCSEPDFSDQDGPLASDFLEQFTEVLSLLTALQYLNLDFDGPLSNNDDSSEEEYKVPRAVDGGALC